MYKVDGSTFNLNFAIINNYGKTVALVNIKCQGTCSFLYFLFVLISDPLGTSEIRCQFSQQQT